ncbi:MAG: elongation factor G [Defluviitaleaceae bacterium]|nr:elongation factor G [Defluviitaleaceae bacterium]
MKVYSADKIRNVVVLGHSGCGKTAFLEAALHVSGVISRMGKVEDGSTVSDYEAEEVKRKVSIGSSIIPIEWKDEKINFIDTPGFFDFSGEVKQALSIADLALIIVSAKSGIEVGTEKAWEYAEEMGIPRIIFVNNMDDENANMDKVVEDMKALFGKSIAPLQVPFKEGGTLVGFANAIKKEGRKFVDGRTPECEIPADLVDEVDKMHSLIEEAVAETSDELMEKYFEGIAFTTEEIETGIYNGLVAGNVTPVFCGSASLTKGVRVLLNSILKFAPPASIRETIDVKDMKTGDVMNIKYADSEPLTAFVFKTIADPYVGRLTIFKVVSGVMKKDAQLYNPLKDTTEKAGQLYVMRGKEQIAVDEIRTGDIGALAKLTSASTGDSLCDKARPVVFDPIDFPPSLMTMAIYPKAKGDEDKISQALAKLLEEDKTLKFEVNPETKQTLISGVGDSHLDVVVNKLKNKYKLEVELSEPILPYREMIKTKVRVQGKYKKQSGGSGQYGDVHIEFEPSGDATRAYIFEEKVFGGSVPRQYFPAVEKGLQDSVKAGPVAGYPVVGLKATLVDGSYHAVDSSELAFKMATIMAFKDGFMKAKPVILEPIARVEVKVPDDYTGDVMGDMNKRRGRILGMEKQGTKQVINTEVPLAEMAKYSTDLRSMTQGRGSYTLEFDRYEEAPRDIMEKIIEKRKKELS